LGEWFNASVRIGGKMPRSLLPDLLDAIEQDGGGLDWDEGGITEADLIAAVAPNESLLITNPQASYGQMDAIEAFCRENGLAFRSACDAHYELAGEVHHWRPGFERVLSAGADNDGNVYATLAELVASLNAGCTLADVVEVLRQRDGEHDFPPFELVARRPRRAQKAAA
jgi:hypothetical protein